MLIGAALDDSDDDDDDDGDSKVSYTCHTKYSAEGGGGGGGGGGEAVLPLPVSYAIPPSTTQLQCYYSSRIVKLPVH